LAVACRVALHTPVDFTELNMTSADATCKLSQVFGSCVDSLADHFVEFIHNLGDVCCTCVSVRRSLEVVNIWQVRCARRGLTLSSGRSGLSMIKQDEWQHVASTLARRFAMIVDPLPAKSLRSLASCAEFVPRAIRGEASFCVQLQDDTPLPCSEDEIRYIKLFSHTAPMQFDGDEFRVELEEASFPDEEDASPSLTAWLRWEPKRQSPYEGLSRYPKCKNGSGNGSFAAVRARIHCLFLEPYPHMAEISSDGEAVLRTAFGEIPKHVCQGDGTGWDVKPGSNFGRAWSKHPASSPIFVFIHLGSYRNDRSFRRIVEDAPRLCMCDIFGEEEACQDAPGITVSS